MEKKAMATQSKLDEDLIFPLPFGFLVYCFWKYIISIFLAKKRNNSNFNQESSHLKLQNSSEKLSSILPLLPTKVIGHRGSRATDPENSMQGFQVAMDTSDGLELDTQTCKSGELIVLHDSSVDRTSSGKGLVANFTIRELDSIHLENGEKIPRLKEVLENFADKTLINIEIKKEISEELTKASALAVVELIKDLNLDLEKILVSSFSPLALYYVRKFQASIPRAQLISDRRTSKVSGWKGSLLGSKFFAIALRADAIVWEKSFLLDNPKLISKLKSQGFLLYTYTSNEEVEWRFFLEYKLDGIITDYPAKAKRFVQDFSLSSKNLK